MTIDAVSLAGIYTYMYIVKLYIYIIIKIKEKWKVYNLSKVVSI